MPSVFISKLDVAGDPVEVVERKGLGHPDTICDALAETLSRNLCREYLRRFDRILHHNVDKALLCGGRSEPAFRGGSVLAPIDIYLAGRATIGIGSDKIPIEEIAIEGSRTWLRENLHALDADRQVRFRVPIQTTSEDLQSLFSRSREVPLANDTSFGVGHAPMSVLEHLVLAVEDYINGRDRVREHPAWGEDVKVMGVRREDEIQITVACAMIGKYLADMDDYLEEKAAIQKAVENLAAEHAFHASDVAINAADDGPSGSIYLTVTGTSAEAGDDGQVGRGNRANGLITPCRPMSLEAAAGKNPVSHVGKIYNVVARQIASEIVEAMPDVAAADCLIVSRIGRPVNEPELMRVRVETRDGIPIGDVRRRVNEIAGGCLDRIPRTVEEFVEGKILVV
jgi:S-adenosylmethionine synthetase